MRHADFESFGLTRREAAVYAALVARGPMTVSQLVEGASLIRTSLYDRLRSMEGKGLVTRSAVNGVTRFAAVPVQAVARTVLQHPEAIKQASPAGRSGQGGLHRA